MIQRVLQEFFSSSPSLKICGVTSMEDAQALVAEKVPALGINFWPPSKRYCSPDDAWNFAHEVKGQILRVGVFVNNARPLAEELFRADAIDIVQLHGDESWEDVMYFLDQGIPTIRAVSAAALPEHTLPTENFALLIDTPAGKDYGGTGKTFDWSIAEKFVSTHPGLPILLAGGIVPENASLAQQQVRPAALDVASGAECAPGKKEMEKVRALQKAIRV